MKSMKKINRYRKSFFGLLLSLFAALGLASAYFLLFAPDRIPAVVNEITAHGSSYELPDPRPPSGSDDSDVKALKSFSKVFVKIAKNARPALVYIRTKKKAPQGSMRNPYGFPDQFFFPFGRPPGADDDGQPRFQEGAGSGFIVDLGKGYIVTNNHVIEGAESITISTIDDKEYKGKLIGGHKDSDIAVVQFENMAQVDKSTLTQVVFGDSDKVEVGDWVVALGAPFQLPQTLTVGVVSALGRERIIGGGQALEDFIQTDAAINPGNSGGPLLSIDGAVIGINTAISSMTGSYAGIGFSVPSNIAHNIAERLINTGKVERGFIGIQGQDVSALSDDMLKKIGLNANQKGALVFSVIPGSPGDKAGLQPYDVIVALDSSEIKNFSQLRTKVAFMSPGSSSKISVLRAGKKLEMNLRIGNSEDFKQEGEASAAQAEPSASENFEKYGMTLRELTAESRKSLGVNAANGVMVAEVDERGLAARFGFRKADIIVEINRAPVKDPKSVLDAFQNAEKEGKEILVLIERQRRTKLLIVSMR